MPHVPGRRLRVAGHSGTQSRMHWPGVWHGGAHRRRDAAPAASAFDAEQPLPLLVLVDVSGSMERYARLLLAFLHAATRTLASQGRAARDVFAFGTDDQTSTPKPSASPTPTRCSRRPARPIDDFAGGTRLGESLAQLRRAHARRLIGRHAGAAGQRRLDTRRAGRTARAELQWLRRLAAACCGSTRCCASPAAPLARGANELHRAADAMLAVHNLQALEDLARSIALLRSR